MNRKKAEQDAKTAGFRIPPQAIEVEKHVIGAMLMGDEQAAEEAMRVLAPRDFYLEKHELIFKAIQSLRTQRKPADMLTLSEELRRFGHFDSAGGTPYLMEISAEVVSAANVSQHSQIVKDKAILRQVISMATNLLETAYDGSQDANDVVNQAEANIYALADTSRASQEGLVDMRTAVMRMTKTLDDRAIGKSDRVLLGIPAIDDITKGLRRGSLNVLAARPKIGKSALLLQAAIQCKKPVPIFSMEMLIEEEVERMIAHLDPSMNSESLASQAFVMAKRAALAAVLTKIADYPIEICESSRVTWPFVLSESRRMKRKYGELGFILIDYMQMMEAVGNHARRDLEVGSITAGLKKVGGELKTAILAAASLSRKPEERDNKRPTEADLREAGQIESDAHAIILMYRESRYSQKAERDPKIKNITEVNIPINRGGGTGRTLLDFNGAQSWFYPVSYSDHQYYKNFLAGRDFEGDSRAPEPRAGKTKKPKGGDSGSWHNGDGMGGKQQDFMEGGE